MDIKLLIVKAITLVYQENILLDKNNSTIKPIIKQALEFIKLPDNGADEGLERNNIVHLRTTLMWMLQCPDSQPYDKNDLLQRLRINLGGDENTFDAFTQSIVDYDDLDKLTKQVNRGKREIITYLSKEKAKDVLKKASHKMAFKSNEIPDLDSFLKATIATLAEIDVGGTDTKTDPAFVSTVDFGKKESVIAAFREMEQVLSSNGTIKMPWQKLNAMLGDHDGVRRGETHLWNALPHNYKSGILMDTFVGACIFNKPFLFDETKRPAIVLFSTEDDVPIIIQKIYVILKQRETGLPVLIKKINNEEATEYVMSALSANGWHVFIHRVRPSMFNVHKYISTLEDYKANGFEVAMVVCDYLAMFDKEGCKKESTGDDVQDLYRRTREYNAAGKIAFITAHQLSTEAKALKRIKPDNFIQDLPGKGYYEGCRKIDTEVDFEGYVNKRTVVNGTYLEFLWGKHRKVGATAETHKYFAMRFLEPPMYGIAYDFDGEDSSFKVVGGKPNTEGGGKEWFDIED